MTHAKMIQQPRVTMQPILRAKNKQRTEKINETHYVIIINQKRNQMKAKIHQLFICTQISRTTHS